MNREKYLAQRKTLTDAAQKLIDEGKLEDFEAKTKEIEALDTQFENAAKAQANLNALNGNIPASPIVDSLVDGGTISNEDVEPEKADMYDTVEYRKAFMNNVLAGKAIPSKFLNADESTGTGDVGSVIPTTIMTKIVEDLEATGMILPLVTRTSYKGGVSVPISNVKPIAVWVAEGKGSDKQKKQTGSITFNYYKLRCAVSMSLEVATTSLSFFEATFTKNVAEAMTKASEQAIISGDGNGKPKGILTETAPTGQALSKASVDYQLILDAEGALPLANENEAVWCMTKKTFMAFYGVLDENKQPVARTNYGIAGKPERALLGRKVILCDYLDSYSPSLAAGKKFAFLFNFKDYAFNTNYNMTIKTYEDNETDDLVKKAIMLADGKVISKQSLVTIAKKA